MFILMIHIFNYRDISINICKECLFKCPRHQIIEIYLVPCTCHVLSFSSTYHFFIVSVLLIFCVGKALSETNILVPSHSLWGSKGGQFVEQKLMLSSSFRYDQIYDFGHSLLCWLTQPWIFSEPTSEARDGFAESDLSSTTKCDQNHICDNYAFCNT
jgi:hypothetical protein